MISDPDLHSRRHAQGFMRAAEIVVSGLLAGPLSISCLPDDRSTPFVLNSCQVNRVRYLTVGILGLGVLFIDA
jgi:hypothetical protein